MNPVCKTIYANYKAACFYDIKLKTILEYYFRSDIYKIPFKDIDLNFLL